MFISATQIHDGCAFLPEGSVLEISDDARIIAIHNKDTVTENIQHYEGMLCPGFINAHCHLELSHMKHKIPQGEGLVNFLLAVSRLRNDFSREEKATARHNALEELKANGVVAVGDIANSNDTLDLYRQSDIRLHTFVEALGFTEATADKRMAFTENVWQAFNNAKGIHSASIAPHAPYSVSESLFGLVNEHSAGKPVSVHNQECAAETELYLHGTGDMLRLLQGLGIDYRSFRASGASSLQTYLPWLSKAGRLLLVHNTFSQEEDLEFVKDLPVEVSWCLCPKANWYIERRLPDIPLLASYFKDNICIGTDSLSSNTSLNILEELWLIQQHFPEMDWEMLLRWATYNGAKALGMEPKLGKIAAGSTPGINHLIHNPASAPTVKAIFPARY